MPRCAGLVDARALGSGVCADVATLAAVAAWVRIVCAQCSVLQGGQLFAALLQGVPIAFGQHDAFARVVLRQYFAPGAGDKGLAPGAPATAVLPALGRGGQVGQVFDGAGAQQDFPVRLAGGVGKGAGHE